MTIHTYAYMPTFMTYKNGISIKKSLFVTSLKLSNIVKHNFNRVPSNRAGKMRMN